MTFRYSSLSTWRYKSAGTPIICKLVKGKFEFWFQRGLKASRSIRIYMMVFNQRKDKLEAFRIYSRWDSPTIIIILRKNMWSPIRFWYFMSRVSIATVTGVAKLALVFDTKSTIHFQTLGSGDAKLGAGKRFPEHFSEFPSFRNVKKRGSETP